MRVIFRVLFYLLTLFAMCASIVVPYDGFYVALLATSLSLFAVCITVNIVCTIKVKGKENGTVKNMVDSMLSKAKQNRNDVKVSNKKIKLVVVAFYVYMIMWALAFLFLGSSLVRLSLGDENTFAIGVSVVIVMFGAEVFAVLFSPLKKTNVSSALSPKHYPALYATAYKVARNLGIKKKIYLFFSTESNAAILNEWSFVCVQIGESVCNYCSQDEFEAILYHEFGHLVVGKELNFLLKINLNKRIELLQNPYVPFLRVFPPLFYNGVCNYVLPILEIYHDSINLIYEQRADDVVLKHNLQQHLANSMAKFEIDEAFKFFNKVKCPSAYMLEEAPTNYFTMLKNEVIKHYTENTEFYTDVLLKNSTGEMASHPSLSQRMKAVQVESFDIDFNYATDSQYDSECKQIIDELNSSWHQYFSGHWQLERYNRYAKYLDETANVDENEIANDSVELAHLGYAYAVCGKREKAIELYDQALELNGFNAFALENKGLSLVEANDLTAVDCLMKAIEADSSCLQYCLMNCAKLLDYNGMREEIKSMQGKMVELLEDYRQDAREIYLNPNTTLIECTVSDEKIAKLVDFAEYNEIIEGMTIATKQGNARRLNYVLITTKHVLDEQESYDLEEKIERVLQKFNYASDRSEVYFPFYVSNKNEYQNILEKGKRIYKA